MKELIDIINELQKLPSETVEAVCNSEKFISVNNLLAAVLPCPFCGKEPFEGRTKDGRFTIKCYGCGVEMMQDRRDKVRGHWNTRHGS